jgi:hypothetical protein
MTLANVRPVYKQSNKFVSVEFDMYFVTAIVSTRKLASKHKIRFGTALLYIDYGLLVCIYQRFGGNYRLTFQSLIGWKLRYNAFMWEKDG